MLPSEIQCLADLHGYLRYEDVVVPLHFAILPKTKIAEPYIPAPLPLRWATTPAAAEAERATPQASLAEGDKNTGRPADTSAPEIYGAEL